MVKLKKQTFLQGALILVLANGLVKVIGALFKIPLTYLLHEEGMGLFNTAYQLYATLFAIATTGLPVAVSKMVSENLALGHYYETKRIFKCALLLLSIFGLCGAAFLYFGAEFLANDVIKDSAAVLCIRAIAPALFFVAVMSAFRGFFQGRQNMIPTAISEVTEALGKLVIGYGVAFLLINKGIEVASAGAISGVSAGTFCSVAVLLILYKKLSPSMYRGIEKIKINKTSAIMKKLLLFAIPITIGASVSSITAVVDMIMIRSRLLSITFSPETAANLYNTYIAFNPPFESLQTLLHLTENGARWLYGAYSGYAFSMFNLPLTLVVAISMSVVPNISAAFAVKNLRSVKQTTESAISITILFSLPCAIGMSVLAGPILQTVFNTASSEHMLEILAIAILFCTFVSVSTAILQATGNVMLPVRNMLIGAAIKIAANYFWVAIPEINILGAPLGTNLCYLIIAVLNFIEVRKITKMNFSVKNFILKPGAAAVIMGVLIYLLYQPVLGFIGNVRIATILVIGVGGVAYVAGLLLFGALRREDILLLPKGEKIAAFLAKHKLIK